MSIIEHAPAKINLGLRILGKRPDGYHDILSVFQTVGLYDTLTIDRASEPSMSCSDASLPTGPQNLVMRAEAVFHDYFSTNERAAFTLEKKIPVGAGLGGGSSDAAAALRGLSRLYGIDLADKRLYECACRLGSDVPFLLKGGTAVVSGRGEFCRYVEWPFDFTYVLVFPGFGVSTAWAYGSLNGFCDDNGVYSRMTEHLMDFSLGLDEFLASLANDFEPTVIEANPRIGEVKRILMTHGALHAIMSGSGSSVIGLFDDAEKAWASVKPMKNQFDSVFVAGSVGSTSK